jgi:hypothetical protein
VDKKDTHSDRANGAVVCVFLIPLLLPGPLQMVWLVTFADTQLPAVISIFKSSRNTGARRSMNSRRGLTLLGGDAKRSH